MRTGSCILYEHCHINLSEASNVRLSPSETIKSGWIDVSIAKVWDYGMCPGLCWSLAPQPWVYG